MSDFKTDIVECLKKTHPHLTANSLKSYVSTLANLPKKVGGDCSVAWIKGNTAKVIAGLKDVEPNKRRSIFASVFALTACEKIKVDMNADIKVVNANYRKQKKSDTEKDNWIDWVDVLAKYKDMTIEANKIFKMKVINEQQFGLLSRYVLLSFFVLMPPRRVLDFSLLKWGDKKTILDLEFNYVFKDEIIFNQYKTAKCYKQQVFTLPNGLVELLKKWRTINKSDFVIVDDGAVRSSNDITKLLNEIFSPLKVSCDMLRHSFITDFLSRNPSLEECDRIAHHMAHSQSQQQLYRKID